MEIKQKKRTEIAHEFKWHLHDLYPTADAWRQSMDAMAEKIKTLTQYKGQLSQPETLLRCLDEIHETGAEMEQLYAYAHLKLHEDTNIADSQGMADRSEGLYVKFLSAASYIDPEILAADEAVIMGYTASVPGLKIYTHYLAKLFQQKAHVRSEEVEALLADAQEIGNAPSSIYHMLHDADMKFGQVTDENGNDMALTHGRFIRLLESKDRRVREETFNTYYDAYEKQKNTLAAAYSASVKKDCFFAGARRYESALASALSNNHIPQEVYANLIDTVHEFLPEMHRYVRLRKKALNLPELHMYDLYTPIVAQTEAKVSYDEAKEKVLKGVSVLGKDYAETVRSGFEQGWVDVYENEGKQSGAYSWGVPKVHPYVLMNYEDNVDSLFTLAHEMGHALHSHYTQTTQPTVYASYSIFLAEVASTVNEALLMNQLLSEQTDPKMRAYLINYFLEQFRTTLFRQTMFAEFEMLTHEMTEKGEPLTSESLNKLYRELNLQYYGPDMVVDNKIDYEWSRIPHFYTAFYVYQYATGFSAAMSFASQIAQPGEAGQAAVDAYLGFLKSGSSDHSINILKKAGVDMSSPQPVREALTKFSHLLDEMEQLV